MVAIMKREAFKLNSNCEPFEVGRPFQYRPSPCPDRCYDIGGSDIEGFFKKGIGGQVTLKDPTLEAFS